MGGRFRGGRYCERIMVKNSFSRFKNTASDPIVIDVDDDSSQEAGDDKKIEEKLIVPEPENMILDILSPDDPPTLETLPSIITQFKTNEVMEFMMKDLSMDDDVKLRNKSGAENRDFSRISETVSGKNKGKSPMCDEKKPKKLKSEPSDNASNQDNQSANQSAGRYTIVIDSTPRRTRSSSRLINVASGSSCKQESPSSPAKEASSNHHSRVKLEAAAKKDKHTTGSQRKPRTASSNSRKRFLRLGNLKTRTSPKTLYETISGLNTAQKEAVKAIGLKSFINMRLDGVPSKLGFFVVDRLDTTMMQIQIPSGNIGITVDSVHKMLGLPLGGVDLVRSDVVGYGLQLVKKWRMQFKKLPIRPSDVVRQINTGDDTGFMFKVNILVLFVNLMVNCNIMGTCNVKFLSRIKNEQMISQIDWCRYIFEKVRTSKLRWNRDNNICFYTGPLSFLTLLYIEATEVEKDAESRKKLPLELWHIGLLRKRETKEIRDGGFGLFPINADYEVKHTMEEGECSRKHCTRDNELGKQEYADLIEMKIKIVRDAKQEAERSIRDAITKFPDDPSIAKFKTEWEDLLGCKPSISKDNPETSSKAETEQENVNVDQKRLQMVVSDRDESAYPLDECWDSPNFVAEVVQSTMEVERSEIRKSLSMSKSDDDSGGPLDFDLGISPDKKVRDTSIVTKSQQLQSALKSAHSDSSKDKGKKAVTFSPIPIASFEDEPVEHVQTVTHKEEEERETRRTVKPGDHLRSPYVQRCVNFHVSNEEKRLHEFIMADFGGKNDYVFWSYDNTRVTRVGMESLAANTAVDRRVIDCWATVLNYDERYRNRSSPRRYFFDTTVMDDMELNSRNVNVSRMYNWFKKKLTCAAKNQSDVINMKDLELVFFPLMKGEHMYVVVFNLKNPNALIIDSMYAKPTDDDTMMKSYNYVTDILEILMIEHLTRIGHPAGDDLNEVGQERLQLEWQTHHNYQDSGVYVMRVMETFMGDVKTWKIGFENSEPKQESQITNLKMKYVWKMLMSNFNKHRDTVKNELATFLSMTSNARATILEKARVNRWDRMNN